MYSKCKKKKGVNEHAIKHPKWTDMINNKSLKGSFLSQSDGRAYSWSPKLLNKCLIPFQTNLFDLYCFLTIQSHFNASNIPPDSATEAK